MSHNNTIASKNNPNYIAPFAELWGRFFACRSIIWQQDDNNYDREILATDCSRTNVVQSRNTDTRYSDAILPQADLNACIVALEHDGRVVKQEQWERSRAKRKSVIGSKHCGDPGVSPPGIFRDCIRKILHFLAY